MGYSTQDEGVKFLAMVPLGKKAVVDNGIIRIEDPGRPGSCPRRT
jgi:hypothetical protein